MEDKYLLLIGIIVSNMVFFLIGKKTEKKRKCFSLEQQELNYERELRELIPPTTATHPIVKPDSQPSVIYSAIFIKNIPKKKPARKKKKGV